MVLCFRRSAIFFLLFRNIDCNDVQSLIAGFNSSIHMPHIGNNETVLIVCVICIKSLDWLVGWFF